MWRIGNHGSHKDGTMDLIAGAMVAETPIWLLARVRFWM
jgi:hypothetical protein